MKLDLKRYRLLFAGPKVARLLPFFTQRGYVADATSRGDAALNIMRTAKRHVLLVELELDDMLVADVLAIVHSENLAEAVILLDDPAKSGPVVSALARGIDGYVATPPNEAHLFRLVERQLLAHWALTHGDDTGEKTPEHARLEKSLKHERSKVNKLAAELALVRHELKAANARAAAAAAQHNEHAQPRAVIPFQPPAPSTTSKTEKNAEPDTDKTKRVKLPTSAPRNSSGTHPRPTSSQQSLDEASESDLFLIDDVDLSDLAD